MNQHFYIGGHSTDYLATLPVELPSWPLCYLTSDIAAIIPAAPSSGYRSLLIHESSQIYVSSQRSNNLIDRTRYVHGLNKPMLWALGNPELFRDICPRIEMMTAWTSDLDGFLAMGVDQSRAQPWFNIHRLRAAWWSPARFRNGQYYERRLCVKIGLCQQRLTRLIEFTTSMGEELLNPLLHQTATLYHHANWGQQLKLPFLDVNNLPAPPRGREYDYWAQHQRIRAMIINEVESRYQYDSQHNKARALTKDWMLLL